MKKHSRLIGFLISLFIGCVALIKCTLFSQHAAQISRPHEIDSDVLSTSPMPSIKPPSQTAQSTWNIWLEDYSTNLNPRFNPIKRLKPNKKYSVIVDLSTVSYKNEKKAVTVKNTGQDLFKALTDEGSDTFAVTAYVLQDTSYFESISISQEFDISRTNYNNWYIRSETNSNVPKDIFENLKQNPTPPFLLGRAKLSLQTKKDVRGITSIAVLIWKDGVPIDEMIVPVCIAPDDVAVMCEGVPQIDAEDETDPLTIMDTKTKQPEASLHLVELVQGQKMLGLFKERGSKTAIAWSLDYSAQTLEQILSKTLIGALNKTIAVEDDGEFRRKGKELLNLIFPSNSPARLQFIKFVEKYIKNAPENLPPTLLVRAVPYNSDTPMMLPVGLIAVSSKEPEGPELIGFHIKIEQPLARQATNSLDCPKQWTVVAPAYGTSDSVLDLALKSTTTLSGEIWKQRPGLQRIDTTKALDEWLENGVTDQPTAILILSHHDKNQIWFNASSSFTFLAFERTFVLPSVAILDGCGTAEPGTSELVKMLNQRGIRAAIATLTKVSGDMAGAFIDCLTAKMKQGSTETAISDVYFQTLICLKDKSPPLPNLQPSGAQVTDLGIPDIRAVDLHSTEPQDLKSKDNDAPPNVTYGARALTYVLLGNGNVHLCPPP